jgi:methylthioribose-1-phosphate isomerase
MERTLTSNNAGDTGIQPIRWADGVLCLLDQRLLPAQVRWLRLETAGDTADAIRDLVVRGAPAIGLTAAYGAVLAAREAWRARGSEWQSMYSEQISLLAQARPTAVNLRWALTRMNALAATLAGDPEAALLAEAQTMQAEDLAVNRRMGRLGAELIGTDAAVMTHCNAGALATAGYGTALGVIRTAWTDGRIRRVYAGETRPWLQGSRLTAWELSQDGIPVTLLADSAAAQLFRREPPDWVIVGADRIAANGDVANKIGTYSLAVAARFHGVRFMVVAPTSTVDLAAESGLDIPIEERGPDEIWSVASAGEVPEGVTVANPVFDITPAHLIDAIVTENGVASPPDAESVARIAAPRP